MLLVQFRVHPGVGCARMGNSEKAYHLASEFPYFLQEAYPKLRFTPRARVHPKKFFGGDKVARESPPGTLADIFAPSFDDKFKEVNIENKGIIFPQAVRFRIFAYVYDDALGDTTWPQKVFEVRADVAHITWKVNIANKKSQKRGSKDPHENSTTTSTDLDTSDARLICKRVRPVDGLPILAYVFLERDDGDKSKVTGRLHVIGNEGDFEHPPAPGGLPTSLWSDDWYDSAGDGSVQALVKPKDGGNRLREIIGAASTADLKYLDYGTEAPLAGSAASIKAMPGWVVVACPDYVPDMGHFVSLWDVALDRGLDNIEKSRVTEQRRHHMLISTLDSKLDTYKHSDYLIHIHPQLCLFDDVKFVSGEAFGDPENRPKPPEGRAHNIHGSLPAGAPAAATAAEAISKGGILIKARANLDKLKDPALLKDTGPGKKIASWLKVALVARLRRPGTLYNPVHPRSFIILRDGERGDGTRREGTWPRKLGRRMDYDKRPDDSFGPDKNLFYKFPNYEAHTGHLLKFHGLTDAGSLCGGTKSPPTAGPPRSTLTPEELALLPWMDDMYWPATVSDMPLLRDLAYTPHQYGQFTGWSARGTDVRSANVLEGKIVGPALKRAFDGGGNEEALFLNLLLESPLFAPAVLDMACLGTMLGGSFLPGIEVGREAGIAKNWSLFHGATKYFPTIRFKPCDSNKLVRDKYQPDEHSPGTLTKDLAVPWSEDFKACDEAFWPTSRPGRTTKDGTTRQNWQITHDTPIPWMGAESVTGARLAADFDRAEEDAQAHPGDATRAAAARAARDAAAAYMIKFVKEYWKVLGFIRRRGADFKEEERNWP